MKLNKALIILFTIGLTSLQLRANELTTIDTLPPDEVFKVIEYMPHFPGCEEGDARERKRCSDNALIKFISNNINYPSLARENGIEGTAVIRFVVETDGSIVFDSDMKKVILRDPGGGCGAEALRVTAMMPKWVPGKVDGEAVRVQFTLPINFALDDDVDDSTQEVGVKWNKVRMTGSRDLLTEDKTTTVSLTLSTVKEILNSKSRVLTVSLKAKKYSEKFEQYHLARGEKGEQLVIFSGSKNKSAKKKLLKGLQSGEKLYFYNTKHKRCFLIITIK